jgi:hypothetical protein
MRALVLLLACVPLAACGASAHRVASTGTAPVPASTPPPPTPPASTPATTPTATAPVPATTATAPPVTTTTAARPVSGLCTAAHLALSVLSQQGAAGHGVIALALRNTSPTACHTYGFPGVLFLDGGGGGLVTEPSHVTSDFVGPVPERALRLAPGQSASFRLVVSHGTASPGSCGNAAALQVIPPDDTGTLRTSLSGGLAECRTVTVSPMQAGTSANPA